MSRIKKFDGQGEYDKAADLIEEINWKRVKSASTLCSVAAILGRAQRYDEEKELLLMAYDRASIGRSILYGLTENALRSQDIDGAKNIITNILKQRRRTQSVIFCSMRFCRRKEKGLRN